MKKYILLLLLSLFSYTIVQAQKNITWSIDGSYRAKFKNIGIGTQIMIPVYKNILLAPKIEYFFEKENKLNSGFIKYSSLNYGVDIHYAFYIKKSKSFVSPFIGFEGMTSWSKVSGTYLALVSPGGLEGTTVKPPISEKRDYSGDFTDTSGLGNIGISGKWFISNNIFINTQVKYVVLFRDMDDNHFVFTTGIGYAF